MDTFFNLKKKNPDRTLNFRGLRDTKRVGKPRRRGGLSRGGGWGAAMAVSGAATGQRPGDPAGRPEGRKRRRGLAGAWDRPLPRARELSVSASLFIFFFFFNYQDCCE